MLTELWQRLDRDPPLFFEDQLEPAFGGARCRVLDLRLLRQTAPSRSAVCRGCGLGHVGRVEWLPNARSGGRTAFAPCPVCGPVRIDPDSLRQWLIDIPVLHAALRDAGGFRGGVTEVIAGRVWHLGNAAWCRRSCEAYLLRGVRDDDRARVTAALATHPRAVLFFPTEAAAHKWGATTANPAVALESVVALGSEGLTFDTALVECRLADASPVESDPKPRPKRAGRRDAIARLTDAMAEHLRTASENARSLSGLGFPPVLSPRPTRKELGTRVGLSETQVSRCFDDPSARELNYYWDLALDLDRVLAFRNRISTGPDS